MIIKNSVKQLIRTPVKSFFFFVLLTFTIAFFTLGYNLLLIANKNIDHINNTFTTIGTVEQKAKSPGSAPKIIGNTEHGLLVSASTAKYGKMLPLSVLDFKDTNYILKPEHRPLYISYDPKYIINVTPMVENYFDISNLIVLMEPVQDCKTGKNPIKMKIKKVLFGKLNKKEILFNTLDEIVQPFYKGKTYIAYLNEGPKLPGYDDFEYIPSFVTQGSQFSSNGKRINDSLQIPFPWDEITNNFFNTNIGKRWLSVLEGTKKLKHELPVIPTSGTKLLMAFYNRHARVNQGRDISPKEYKEGKKVCLIPRNFAISNKLKIGNRLHLSLVYANYKVSSSQFSTSEGIGGNIDTLLNARGEGYSTFEDSMYKIVGIYDNHYQYSTTGYELGYNTVIIPSASVKNSDKNNILNYGYMKGFNTSFQIPNGQIGQYNKKWEALGINDLQIKFYDNGYSKIMNGLEAMKNTAFILFSVGTITCFIVIILFCNLFITKQKKRTAIERSLGMSKKNCISSLLTGVLALVISAYIFGSFLGYFVSDYTTKNVNILQSQEAFDSSYSDWDNSSNTNSISNTEISTKGIEQGALAALLVIPLTLIVAYIFILKNLKSEPLKLLGEKNN